MEQLGNQDAGFIYQETRSTPMHISGLGIYDQSTAPGGRLGHKDIIKYVQDRLHFAPIFRQKLVEVPFGLDRPYWVDDPEFDIEFHIRHIALPYPGDWRQLCIMVSRLNSRPLDFNHPLWEAYIIEGLDNVEGLPKGSFAILTKVHHAAVDGASGQSVFAALHDLTPDAKPERPERPLMVDRMPTDVELIARALPNVMKRPWQQTKDFYSWMPKMARKAYRLARGEEESGCHLKVPATRFNRNVSPHRVFEGLDFPLDDVKHIKNVVGHGTTLNDVMLTMIGGALRRYLAAHGELPEEGSLGAILPQDVRSAEDVQKSGNNVGALFADLHTDIVDPVERLKTVHDSTSTSKKLALEIDTAAFARNYMGGFLIPMLGKRMSRAMQNMKLMERFGPFVANTLITNVPGPNFPLYHAGARMVGYYGMPPLLDGIGIGHALFSYCGRMSMSVVSCRQMMPDPQFYIQCCRDSFDELMAAARKIEEGKAKAAVKPKPSVKVSAKASAKAVAAPAEATAAAVPAPSVAKTARRTSSSAAVTRKKAVAKLAQKLSS